MLQNVSWCGTNIANSIFVRRETIDVDGQYSATRLQYVLNTKNTLKRKKSSRSNFFF